MEWVQHNNGHISNMPPQSIEDSTLCETTFHANDKENTNVPLYRPFVKAFQPFLYDNSNTELTYKLFVMFTHRTPHKIYAWFMYSCNLEWLYDKLFRSYSIHYNDVIMSAMASQITSVSIDYSTVCSGTNQRKHQISASLAFGGRCIPRTKGQ